MVVGHNMIGFDAKKLRFDWAEAGFPPPSPVKYVDTLSIAKREFGSESNTLDALCKRFGLLAKSDRYSAEMAKAAVAGNRDAQRQLRDYNMGDIVSSLALYEHVKPWHPGHPHAALPLVSKVPTCNSCWGSDLEPNGYTLANQLLYRLYRCACGANVKGERYERAAITSGAR